MVSAAVGMARPLDVVKDKKGEEECRVHGSILFGGVGSTDMPCCVGLHKE